MPLIERSEAQELLEPFSVCPNGKGTYWDMSLTNPEKQSTIRDMFSKVDTDINRTEFKQIKSNSILLKKDEG